MKIKSIILNGLFMLFTSHYALAEKGDYVGMNCVIRGSTDDWGNDYYFGSKLIRRDVGDQEIETVTEKVEFEYDEEVEPQEITLKMNMVSKTFSLLLNVSNGQKFETPFSNFAKFTIPYNHGFREFTCATISGNPTTDLTIDAWYSVY